MSKPYFIQIEEREIHKCIPRRCLDHCGEEVQEGKARDDSPADPPW